MPREVKRHCQGHTAGERQSTEQSGWMRGKKGQITEKDTDTQIRSAGRGPGALCSVNHAAKAKNKIK